MYPFRDLNLFAGVPPSLIHHQKYAFVLAGCHLSGKLIERYREELGVYRGQDQPVHLSALGVHEAVEIGPLVASLEAGNGSLPYRRPHSSYSTGFRPRRASSSAHNCISASGCARWSSSSLTASFFESLPLGSVGPLGI